MSNNYGNNGFHFAYSKLAQNPIIETCIVETTDSTAIYQGDLVKLGTGSSTANPQSYITVAQSQPGDGSTMLAGIVDGKDPIQVYTNTNIGSENLYQLYRPASILALLNVCTDPFAVYNISTSDGTLTNANAYGGKKADIANAGGSTSNGVSGMSLDVGTISTTSTLPLTILKIAQVVGNDPTSSGMLASVMLNNHYTLTRTGV